jgi:hypothetical protein
VINWKRCLTNHFRGVIATYEARISSIGSPGKYFQNEARASRAQRSPRFQRDRERGPVSEYRRCLRSTPAANKVPGRISWSRLLPLRFQRRNRDIRGDQRGAHSWPDRQVLYYSPLVDSFAWRLVNTFDVGVGTDCAGPMGPCGSANEVLTITSGSGVYTQSYGTIFLSGQYLMGLPGAYQGRICTGKKGRG